MMRMVALGLVVPLGIGVLSAMELSTPPRSAAPAPSRVEQIAIVRSTPDPAPVMAGSQDTLAKGDRLEMAALSRATPAVPAPIDEPVTAAVSERVSAPAIAVLPPEPARPANTHRPETRPAKAAAAPRPKPAARTEHAKAAPKKPAKVQTAQTKPAEPRRTVVSQRPQPAGETGPCRLKAFGGLLRALGSTDCDI